MTVAPVAVVEAMVEMLGEDLRRKAQVEAGIDLSNEDLKGVLRDVIIGRDIWQALVMKLITLPEAADGITGRFQTWLEHRARTPSSQPARTDWQPLSVRVRSVLERLLARS